MGVPHRHHCHRIHSPRLNESAVGEERLEATKIIHIAIIGNSPNSPLRSEKMVQSHTPQYNTGPEGGSAIRLIKNGVAEVVTGCRGSREETTIDHFVGLSK